MIKKLLRRIEQLLHYNLLRVDAAEHSHLRRGYRLIYYTLRGVNMHRTMVDSAALTLYTLLALVPILTLVLLILGRVGFVDKCVTLIYASVPQEWNIMLDNLITTANGAAAKIVPGFVAIVGIAALLLMIFTLFRTIEGSFNRVFGVAQSRGFIRRYIAYIIIALFVPTLLLTAMTIAYDLLAMAGLGAEVNDVVGSIISMALVALASTLMYKYLPYTRVEWRNALYAGFIAGVSLSVWMKGYVYFQHMMTSYNIIYGSLAAIPLFIICLQVSWNIILVGCELCAVWQYRHRYERIDRRRIRVIAQSGKAPTRVVIVGSGNVAEAFASAMGKADGVELVQVLARNSERGMAVAKVGGCSWVADPEELAEADIYIISVSDRSVRTVAESLQVPKGALLVHTAGSVPIDALPTSSGRGIFYPLQSFTKGRTISLSDVPIFVEADNEATRERLMNLAATITSRVEYADSRRRREIHLAGVFVNNFVNHLYAIGADIVEREGLAFDILKPLIMETAKKAVSVNDPLAVQTGPASRDDVEVIRKHIEMIKDDELKSKIYNYITKSIWETSKRI